MIKNTSMKLKLLETLASDVLKLCQELVGYMKHSLKFKCSSIDSSYDKNSSEFVCRKDGGLLKIIAKPGSARKTFVCKLVSCSFRRDGDASLWDETSIPKKTLLEDLTSKRFEVKQKSDGDYEVDGVETIIQDLLDESVSAIKAQKDRSKESSSPYRFEKKQKTSQKTNIEKLKKILDSCKSKKTESKEEDSKEVKKNPKFVIDSNILELDAEEFGEIVGLIEKETGLEPEVIENAIENGRIQLYTEDDLEEASDPDLFLKIGKSLWINAHF